MNTIIRKILWCIVIGYCLPTSLSATTLLNRGLEQLQERAVALGSGFSLAGNVVKANCFELETGNIPIISPTFDYQYRFIDIEKTQREHVITDLSIEGRYLRDFIRQHARFENQRHIMAYVKVNSYGSRLDEAKLKLNPDILALLTKAKADVNLEQRKAQAEGRIATFMSLCGSHFVRSVGKTSLFLALLSYQEKTETSDITFDKQLRQYLQGLSKITEDDNKTLESEMKQRQLKIQVQAQGLGNWGALTSAYFPTSLQSFKTAMAKAVELMQKEQSGFLSYLELMAWSDFTPFRIVMPEFQFREWKNFTANLEFMSQVSSEIDRLQEKYTQAKLCHRQLTYDYLTQDEAHYIAEQFSLPLNLLDCVPKTLAFRNHASPVDPKRQIPLEIFRQNLTQPKLKQIQNRYQRLLQYADDCFRHLELGVRKQPYHQIIDCIDTETLIQNWPSYFAFGFIDSYCPPEPVNFEKVACEQ
ncbi:hypothetical protein [Candidatus Parabeggiatoa sp. HSG14]|uniref:hypothetical protein n=1 Tax=Candidatus Parabeggiatoa sp. HSG14 TaxID=3055593 RepID=UPI0025A8949D|nr:hypothetical protein [Thiotrichales bacterium HSG14]